MLDKIMLLKFLSELKHGGYDSETADFIINEINAGHFDIDDEIESRMWVFERIADEREFQEERHEFPEHLRLAVLTEEVGEVAKELLESDGNKVNLRTELIQVAAVAIRWIEYLEEMQK
jgi:NTP pyrophosphatase (non-canonical NTP hydrolase)